MDTWADVRVHGATQRRPVDMFEEERVKLKQLNPPDSTSRACARSAEDKQFRVAGLNTCLGALAPRQAAPDREGLEPTACASMPGRSRRHRPLRGIRAARDFELPERAQQLAQQRKVPASNAC
ncbi:MAG: hypothetical protein IPQ21_21905 [Betaproteobacteria bacterium]|nr:hypothetical protein [Betaproteobacteria bacterium]